MSSLRAPCPKSYFCYYCKEVGEHWVMDCIPNGEEDVEVSPKCHSKEVFIKCSPESMKASQKVWNKKKIKIPTSISPENDKIDYWLEPLKQQTKNYYDTL